MNFSQISRLFHTTRHLRAVQVYARLWTKLPKSSVDTSSSLEPRVASNRWIEDIKQKGKLLDDGRFEFLNMIGAPDLDKPWALPTHSLLWNYNLNYFDFLFEKGKESFGSRLIEKWINANGIDEYPSWAPYPSSLRIVNWIRYVLSGYSLSEKANRSLAIQLRTLSRSIEFHIQANHLLTNGKALLFGGIYFEGREANKWLEKGIKILIKEIPEQTLEDGGNYERSAMYHSIVLKDLLDIINLLNCYQSDLHSKLSLLRNICIEYSQSMLVWLENIRHPDGKIPLFNDAAFNIAPAFDEISAYSQRLGVAEIETTNSSLGLVDLPQSGYFKFQNQSYCLIGDSAPVGPDHQPGHAHADTFTFELSVGNKHVIVDTGTSTYTEHPRRDIERATTSHNTLSINSINSSDVWGHHRVGRRARVTKRQFGEDSVTCSHDGYCHIKGVGLHTREWKFDDRKIVIRDNVEGFKNSNITLYFHLSPRLKPFAKSNNKILITDEGGQSICQIILPMVCEVTIDRYQHSPEFGKEIDALRVIATVETDLPSDLSTLIEICHK